MRKRAYLAMVPGKLAVPGRPADLDDSRAWTYCVCSGCGWGLFGLFYSRLSFLSSFSLSLEDGPIYTETLSQRAFKPKTINQPAIWPSCQNSNGSAEPNQSSIQDQVFPSQNILHNVKMLYTIKL